MQKDCFTSHTFEDLFTTNQSQIAKNNCDELTNESSGRGLLAGRSINEEDVLLKIPLKLCFTKASARQTFGEDIIHDGMNEYLAITLQTIREKFVLGPK